MSRVQGKHILYGYAALIYFFLFMPILVVAMASINPTGLANIPTAFTTKWYDELLNDQGLIDALQRSVLIGVLVALITATVGLLAAYGYSHFRFRGRQAVMGFFYLPMLVPHVVIGIALVIWFNRIGISTGLLTILIAHVLIALPYAVTLIITSFYGFDKRLEEASKDLGANEWRTFKNVTFPLVLPGVVGAALIAFTISFDEFVVTFFVAGGGITTLPLEIYNRIRFLTSPAINAIATVVIVVSMVIILAGQLFIMRRRT